MITPETLHTFRNVRKGGPKEKRIRRVELMGEHKPKPLYFIRVKEDKDGDGNYLDLDVLCEDLEFHLGSDPIGDAYRPLDSDGNPLEFCFIGFQSMQQVFSILGPARLEYIQNRKIEISEAKPWLLDLYPKPTSM